MSIIFFYGKEKGKKAQLLEGFEPKTFGYNNSDATTLKDGENQFFRIR